MAHRATVIVQGVATVVAESTTRDGMRAALSSAIPTLQLFSNTAGLSVLDSDVSIEIEETDRCRARPVDWYYEGEAMKPEHDALSGLPEVDVYLVDGTIRRVRFAGSDGAHAVCVDEHGAFKFPLSRTKRIVLYSGPGTCFEDRMTGCLVSRTSEGAVRNYGPLSVRPNPSINLAHLVSELGVDVDRVPVRLPGAGVDTPSDSAAASSSAPVAKSNDPDKFPSLMEIQCQPPTIDMNLL